MENQPVSSNSFIEACLKDSPTTHSGVETDHEPFLNYISNTEFSFDEKSRLYNSLVALVKAKYPFDDALQERADRFLNDLEPEWGQEDLADQLVTDLVPSSGESHSEILASILTLLSSPHSTLKTAAMSFLNETTRFCSLQNRYRLVESDIVTKLLTTVQPHTLPIPANEEIVDKLITIIVNCLQLSIPFSLKKIGVTAAVEKYNHREIVLQKVVIPSSQFMTFLISTRYILNGDLLDSFMDLLTTLLEIGPFHRPTLEYVLGSPIAMAFSSCLSIVEDNGCLWTTLSFIHSSLREWTEEGPEVVQSGKRTMQALFSEGFEDTLEQKMKHNKGGNYVHGVVTNCHFISEFLGSNVERPQWLHRQ
ncbi:hypothetical protein BLNAU_7193 [Blattamonas nauphoetae]|uniref:Uncharacterized protein n=1 Tax=Blattamonas nauphoetae TaxID=2049346 RepID=A0ABQ9Y275_9EUKA|nr:hypothetical protein BLNAU_7193 [Blattamonas nauphoetae]